MIWNHRVVRRVHRQGRRRETEYAIHEAFYWDKRSKKKVSAVTVDPIAVRGSTKKELRETLERMLRALDAPVIDYDTRKEI
jgi:hypothetical protein